MSDLTKATGLTKGSIYGNFKNKDEVAVCAFHHNLSFIIESLTSEIDKADTYVEKLLAYPRVYCQNIKVMIAIGGCPILNTVIDADNTNETLRKLAVETIVNWKSAIMKLVRKGKTAGEIKGGTDAAAVAENIISLIEGGNAMTKATGRKKLHPQCHRSDRGDHLFNRQIIFLTLIIPNGIVYELDLVRFR